ncbi:MAG TPA: hypothetical protein ENJ69_02170 [Bacteroidetes bacterium]|nr:hypothetical protein [Bacteroidota bacterium]
MKSEGRQQDELWLRAAVVGGLWASIEIIVGSFLHNSRLPFAGSVLAFTGTVLLVGFYQIWPYKGLIIRAGLITAIMKSVSPSAIILGPMTGIMLEAILIEGIIRLFGANLLAYSIAGIFSLSSALFHKIISLIIYYGFNLVKIYVNIINFGLKQLHLPQATDVQILWFLLSFYVVFGVLAGWLGFATGRKALRLQPEAYDMDPFEKEPRKEFFVIDTGRKTSLTLLWFHVLALPLGLFLVNMHYRVPGLVFMGLYVLVFGTVYRKALRRLRKPVFWSQLVIIVLLSALFWDFGKPDHRWFSTEGFWVGLEMLLRALFIVTGFSALSVELLNEHVRNFLFRIGFGRFYKGIGLAFGSLPVMIGLLPSSREILHSPVKSLLKPLVMANRWLEIFRKEE